MPSTAQKVSVVLVVSLLVVGGLPGGILAQQTSTELEPNDTFETANPIAGGTLTGEVSTVSDADNFALALTQGETVTLDLLFSHAVGDLDLEVLAPNGTVVAQSFSTTDNESITYIARDTGTHVVRVVGFFATGPYTLVVTVGEAADPFEPNDEPLFAAPIDPGTVSAVVDPVGDRDYYSLQLTGGDELTVDLLFSHAEGDLDLTVLGPGQVILARSNSTTDDERVAVLAEQSGTHFVFVDGKNDATAQYTLEVSVTPGENTSDDPFEPNDNADTAATVGPGTFTAEIEPAGDIDFYAVDVATGDELTVDVLFAHSEADISLTLLDPNRNFLTGGFSSTDNERVTVTAAQSGMHFVRVDSLFTGQTAAYTLVVTVNGVSDPGPGPGPNPDPGDTNEPNDGFDTATPLLPNETATGLLTQGDVDVFALDAVAGDTVDLQFARNATGLTTLVVYDSTEEFVTLRVLGSESSATVSFVADGDGRYLVQLAHFGTDTSEYELVATMTQNQSAVAAERSRR